MNYLKVNHLKLVKFTHCSKQKYRNNRLTSNMTLFLLPVLKHPMLTSRITEGETGHF